MKRFLALTIRGNTPLKRLLSSKFPLFSLPLKNQLYFTPKGFFSTLSSPSSFDFSDLIDSFKHEELELHLKKTRLQKGVPAMLEEFELAKRKNEVTIQTYDVILRQLYLEMKNNRHASHLKLMEDLINDIHQNKLTLNDGVINSMIGAYQLSGNIEKALELLKILKGMRSNHIHIGYSRILESLGTLQRYDEMEGLFREARNDARARRSSIYHTMLKIYAKLGETAEVERLLKYMQEDRIKSDSTTYEILIELYSRQGNLEKIKSTTALMRQKNIPIRHDTYTALIRAFINNDDISSALKCIQEMKETHIPFTFRTFSVFLKYFYSKQSDRQLIVEELYAQFVPNGAKVKGYAVPEYLLAIFESLQKYQTPNLPVYSQMISIAGINNRLHMALTLFQQLVRAGYPPTTELCNIILKFLAEHKHTRELEKFAEKMKQSGIPFDETSNSILRRAEEEENFNT